MTTTTRTRPSYTETDTVEATAHTGRRSLRQTIRDRRAERSEFARTAAAYPATRSAAAFTLPTLQIAAGQASVVIPSPARQQRND